MLPEKPYLFIKPDNDTPGPTCPYIVKDPAGSVSHYISSSIFHNIEQDLRRIPSSETTLFSVEVVEIDAEWEDERGNPTGRATLKIRLSGPNVERQYMSFGFTFWEQKVVELPIVKVMAEV